MIIIKPYVNIHNYLAIRVVDDEGKRRTQFVHRLIMYSFKGYSDLEVNHIDCNTLNNKLDNLEYVTNVENLKHASENNLLSKSRLNENNVRLICELLESGKSLKEIIELTNISSYSIRNIKRKKSWVKISSEYNF